MKTRYVNAEDLSEGADCLRRGCGGLLERSPFVEGLFCEVCQTEYVGK